jgi:hypothetical protein
MLISRPLIRQYLEQPAATVELAAKVEMVKLAVLE